MQRLTISLNDDLAQAFDAFSRERSYQSRSEAMRDLVRQAVDARDLAADPDGQCVAALSYVYDHRVRDLAARLTAIGHDHHDLVVTTTHVHLDHDDCLEMTVLRGPARAVRSLADRIRAERGVRFGALNIVGVESDRANADGAHVHHDHARPPARRG